MEASGDGLHFQWQKNCNDLFDGGSYRGTQTDTLHILEVEMGDKGHYRCLVQNSGKKIYSKDASLTISKSKG